MKKFLVLFLVLTLCGCATPMSYREKGFVMGAALGGETGYLIGTRTGHPNLSAGIGAGIGALTGALIGGAIDGVRQAVAAAPPAPPASAVPPVTQASASPISPVPVPAPAPGIQVPGSFSGDPTAGTFVNGTPWRVRALVDAAPGQLSGVAFTLGPGQTQPAHLDIGAHRVTAEGWVDTQLGPRLVGRFDRPFEVDVRGSGWTLRFGQEDFR
jgi:hypothetical protein